jgi:DNA-binding response OmpR family regulator
VSERSVTTPGRSMLSLVSRGLPSERRADDLPELQTVVLRAVVPAAVSARLSEALAGDDAEYLIVSLDGSVTFRARLAMEPAPGDSRWPGNAKMSVDWSAGTVANRDNRVALSRTELRLLNALIAAQGEPVSRADLIARAWPRDAIPGLDRENALAVYICGLRKRLAMVGLATGLETVRGVGYRLRW